MTEQKIDARISTAVVSLTKYLMGYYSIGHEAAYKKLLGTRFFQLLINDQTGLLFEPNWFLQEACIIELEKGTDAMVRYITDMDSQEDEN